MRPNFNEFTVDYFKAMSADTEIPYQTLINLYLRECAGTGRHLAMQWRNAKRVAVLGSGPLRANSLFVSARDAVHTAGKALLDEWWGLLDRPSAGGFRAPALRGGRICRTTRGHERHDSYPEGSTDR